MNIDTIYMSLTFKYKPINLPTKREILRCYSRQLAPVHFWFLPTLDPPIRPKSPNHGCCGRLGTGITVLTLLAASCWKRFAGFISAGFLWIHFEFLMCPLLLKKTQNKYTKFYIKASFKAFQKQSVDHCKLRSFWQLFRSLRCLMRGRAGGACRVERISARNWNMFWRQKRLPIYQLSNQWRVYVVLENVLDGWWI